MTELPRADLGCLPTPVTPAPRLAAGLGVDAPLWLKRDDLTGFAAAGNKTRPLEYLIGAAQADGVELLVSGGTPASNFCQGLAAAGRWAGIGVQLHYAGPAIEPRHPNHLAALAWGAEIRFTGEVDRSSVDAAIASACEQAQATGRRAMPIPRGGGTPASMAGFHRAARELTEQLPGTALVVIALGSGGSHAGLLSGLVALGRPWQLVGVSVSRPVAQARVRALELAQACARVQGTELPTEDDVLVIDGIGPGHGIASAEGAHAAQVGLASTGAVFDPVYGAKALAALPQVVERFPVDGDVVFWQTGGLLDAVGEWYGLAEEQ